MTRLAVATRSLFVCLLVSVALVPGPASSLPADNDFTYDNSRYDGVATLAVEGTLEAVVADDFDEAGATYTYGVRTEQGELIEVPAAFAKNAPTDGAFDGELALTGELASDLRAKGVAVTAGKVIDADSAAGQTAVDVASEQTTPVPVANATVAEPVEAAATPSAHHLYVAIMTNHGDINLDPNALSQIRSYWTTESSGVISSFNLAGDVEYESAAATTDSCGLNGGHEAVWSDAAGEFPGVSFTNGNHLMVIVSDSCSGSAGVARVGTSIVDGGMSIVSGSELAVQIGSHELGHNFGLGHANLEYCTSSCTTDPYFNAFSVMGFAIVGSTPGIVYTPPALDTAFRRFLGLADNIYNLTSTGPTTITLKPRSDSSGWRGVRVVDPLSLEEYFVEYRSGTGRDSTAFYATYGGLDSYRYAPGIVVTQYLQDATHGKATKVLTRADGDLYRAYLTTNDAYVNSNGGVRIEAGPLDGASGATVKITLASNPIPSAAPTFSNLPRVLQNVTAVTNGWAAGTTFTYQWRINGVAVAGATTATYKPTVADYNKDLTVTVTGTKVGYTKTVRNSVKSKVYAGILGGAVPKISGTPKVGYTLKAIPGTWTYGTKFSYRWYANGAAISNATSQTYKITSNRRGAVITVKVTGSRYPFLSLTKTSLPTAKVT